MNPIGTWSPLQKIAALNGVIERLAMRSLGRRARVAGYPEDEAIYSRLEGLLNDYLEDIQFNRREIVSLP